MLLNPLSLMGGAYADNSLTWSAQRTLNWLPETAEVEGTRTPIKFADVPGLRAVVDLGTGSSIRGLHNVEGTLFAVSGTSLFEISTAFGATNRGNIPGVSRVSMAHNKQGGATAANELAIANGLSGYVYNTSTNALVQITDEAFQGATTVDYVDGYITFTDPQGRFWGHSALNQATSFSSIDRYDAESAPDPIISHIVSHREVMVFGTRTIEFFRNTGAATGTFQRVDGTELEVGICSPFARSRVDNSVCWVSDGLEVFRLEGHSPQRISDRPIEQLLHTVNPANIFCFPWEDRGHKVFYITAPEAFTIGFDFASGMWHERQTFDLPRWRISDLVSWNGYWIAGDYTNGLLYVVDWDTHHENGLELIRERASGYTHGGQNKVLAPYVELLFDAGPDNDGIEPDPIQISGDLGDGFTGQSVNFSYSTTGGFLPYGPYSVLSGSLPDGLTMDAAGNVTGTRGTPGTYPFVITRDDAVGNPDDHPDSSTTINDDVWFLNFATNQGYRGKYTGDTWAALPALPQNSHALYGGGQLHMANRGSAIYAYSTNKGTSWTTVSAVYAVTGGRMAYNNGFLFVCAGTTAMIRRALPTGTFTTPTASTNSRAVTLCVHNGTLVNVFDGSDGRRTAARSTDDGATWTLGTDQIATSTFNPIINSDGTRLVVAYRDSTDNLVKIKVSTNTGINWGSVVYTFPTADANKRVVDVAHDGTNWIVITNTGQVAYSSDDAATFTLSASSLGVPNQMAIGIERILVSANGGVIYSSVDHGVTWQTRTDPAGSSNIIAMAWIYP